MPNTTEAILLFYGTTLVFTLVALVKMTITFFSFLYLFLGSVFFFIRESTFHESS